MKLLSCLVGLALASTALQADAQVIPPVDRIEVKDDRVFDMSDGGATYQLVDGPLSTGELSLVQGPWGSLIGSITITDIYNNVYGPITVAGRLSVSPTGPLRMRLRGAKIGEARVQIDGTYDGSLKLMHVKVAMQAPGVSYQWNDSYVPTHAEDVGIYLYKISTLYNDRRTIIGRFIMESPGHPDRELTGRDVQAWTSSRFVFGRSGGSVHGSFQPNINQFVATSASTFLGYGTVWTPGSLIDVNSDYFYVREN